MKKLRLKYNMSTIKEIPVLDFNDIDCVCINELNEDNSCMCGCSGEYYYNKVNRIAAGKGRGYNVGLEEINEKEVQRILDLFLGYKGIKPIEVIEDKDNKYIFTIVISNIQYTIYTI